MADSEISARMREDWNSRAREDAGYYVAFGRRDQDEAGGERRSGPCYVRRGAAALAR